MKRTACISPLLFILIFGAIACLAQDNSSAAQPDRWRGLVLDSTTPEESIRLLGKPSSDKLNDLRVLVTDKWVTEKQKEKIYRTMSFNKLQGLEEVQLSFLENKLVMIRLVAKDVEKADDPNWIDPDDLPEMFGAKFTPWAVKFRRKIPPITEFIQFPGDSPKDYSKALYHMITITDRSFIVARVDDSEDIAVGLFSRGDQAGARENNKERKKKNATGAYPGKVLFIQMISRSLERKQ